MKRDTKGLKQTESLIAKAKKGDAQSLAQLLTAVERDLRGSCRWLAKLNGSAETLKIGITGPPGAGKSSVINLMIQYFREQKHRVGVIAVDPSSPFSGGAILGDRVRMNRFVGDKDVFIRSIGSRGALGGLSAAAGAMARIFAHCGFDILIIETVGVGQTELQVMNIADATAVILVPESGDVVQTLKAGILEIADVFAVNKADRPGADLLARELESLVEQEGLAKRDIFLTSATHKTGILELSQKLLELARKWNHDGNRTLARVRGELRSLILSAVDQDLGDKLKNIRVNDVYSAFGKIQLPTISLPSSTKKS